MRHWLLRYDIAPDYLARRGDHRAEHLRLARAAADRGELLLGGAVGEPPEEALLLFAGDGPEAAQRFATDDPYVTSGLVTAWRVSPWATVVGAGAAVPISEDGRPGLVTLSLIASPEGGDYGDGDFVDSAVQACRSAEQAKAWHTQEAKFVRAFVPNSQPTEHGTLASPGVTVQALEVAAIVKDGLPVLAGLLGAWLQARYGRRVRVKIGELEAEAGSAAEVERLLERAARHRSNARAQDD